MADHESKKVRGWRGLLEDATTSIRERFWAAPATVVYIAGIESCSSDQLPGSTKWFNRVFGPERVAASAELLKTQQLRQRIRKSELTEDQIEEMRAKWREEYHRRKAKQTDEERRSQREKRLTKRAMRTAEEVENERAWFREWRSRQTSTWRDKQNANKNQRRAKNPEFYRAIDRRSQERTKDLNNERRRLRRLENHAEVLRRERVYYRENREKIIAYVRARHAKQKVCEGE